MASILPKRFVKIVSFENRTYLFTGDGGRLLVFENLNDKWKKVDECTIFHKANIYGFDRCESILCIYGEKYFTFGTFSNDGVTSKRLNLADDSKRFFAVDWIWQALFFDSITIALLLGHNNVKVFNRQSETFDLSIQCDDNCLLYSGIFLGSNFSELCVVAGSVFNDILFWTPSVGCRVVQRLQNHEGVVFGLNFCAIRKLLCSTADDRSCRVWKFQCFQSSFSSTWPLPVEEWSAGNFVQLHVFYGHEARVWNAIWLPQWMMTDSLVTVGEDGCINVWSCDCGLIRSWKTSRGSIRSICLDENTKDFIYGTDSGSLFSMQLSESSKLKNVSFIQNLSQGEGIVELCFCKNALLCISNKGCVIVSDELSNTSKPIICDDNLRYTCLNKNDRWIAIGGLSGTLYLFSYNDPSVWHRLKISDDKICSVHFVDDDNILLCCTSLGQMLFYKTNVDSNEIASIGLTLQLPEGRHRWLTCARLEHLTDREGRTILACGDRNGSVCFFEIDKGTSSNQTIFPKIHGPHGVTDLMLNGTNMFHSIGRDGTWRQWECIENQWTLLTATKVGHGFEWPSKFLKLQDKLIVAGFKGNKFTLYDTDNRQYLCDIECGGGHRSYDIKIDESTRNLSFLFAKSGELCLAEIDLGTEKDIIPFFHTRHVKQIVLCKNDDKSKQIFAACSEDSTISVWSYFADRDKPASSDNSLILLQRLKGQTSSVLCLVAVDCFLISGGSRSEICLWHTKENHPYVLIGRYCDVEHSDARYLAMDLINVDGINVLCAARSDGLVNFLNADLERKVITKMSYFSRADCCLTKMKVLSPGWCFIVGTNGTFYILNLNVLDFASNDSSSPKVNSKLKESSKKKKNRSKNRLKSTSNNSSYCQVSWNFELHLIDGGLTALDVRWQKPDETVLCLCGSESGSLTLAVIQLKESVSCLNNITYPSWHTSTIVDVSFVDPNCVISLSVDQRICLWLIDESQSDIRLTHSRSTFSHVSDPSGLCFFYRSNLLHAVVAGSGLQILLL